MREFFLLILIGCESTIEVRKNEVAVALSNNSKYDGKVLKSGLHKVSYNSKVVFYDISPDQIDFSFTYLTNDALDVELKFSMKYEPVADSLASFYAKYESDSINPGVESEVRSIVRKALGGYSKGDLTSDELREKAINAIKTQNDINDFIVIKDISHFEVKR